MVSVLLAAYNGERFIKAQLDSLLSQSLEEMEIVYSDDGSTDETLAILQSYEKEFPQKIRGIYGKPAKSAQGNFFKLLTNVTSDYYMLCDQDDIWFPDKAELTLKEMKRMEAMEKSPAPVLVHSDLSVTDERAHIRHLSLARYQNIAVSDNRFSHYLVENNITGNTIMINQVFKALLSYTPEECVMHDWWLGLLASCFGKIAYIDKPLTLYRQHGGNQLGAASGMEQVLRRKGNREDVKENYKRMFRQAGLFYDHFRDQMTLEQRETIQQFLKLPSMNRREKIQTILKYQFVKSTPLRTLGQMLSI